MIPAYKVMLFSSISASMYMMGRLVLVSRPSWAPHNDANRMIRDTRLGSERTRCRKQKEDIPSTLDEQISRQQCTNNGQTLKPIPKFLFHHCTDDMRPVMLT
jgi:hypothetical protein